MEKAPLSRERAVPPPPPALVAVTVAVVTGWPEVFSVIVPEIVPVWAPAVAEISNPSPVTQAPRTKEVRARAIREANRMKEAPRRDDTRADGTVTPVGD